MFERALAVLERERPSPREDRLFRLLDLLVWGAVKLTTICLLLQLPVVDLGRASVWIARGAAFVYILIIPVFVLNWQMVLTLRRAARMRRRLTPSWRRRLADRFSARRRQRRLANLATLALSGLGYLVGGLGSLGLFFELIRSPIDVARLTLAVVLIVFGLSCVFLHFMARGRERIQVISELRSSLLSDRNAGHETDLEDHLYDEITRIERAQITADRRQSVRAASTTSAVRTFSLKEHRAVHEAKLALVPPAVANVQACIDRLIADPADDERYQMRNGVSYARVPDTSLEIGFSVDWDAREIKVLSLGSTTDDGSSVALRQE